MLIRFLVMNSELLIVYSWEFELLFVKFVEYYEDVLCVID